MSSELYTVDIRKDDLVFACGHFITFNGDTCERLHGHNYRAAVTVTGGLDENGYLFDFVALTAMAKAIVGELDHHVLLPTTSPLISVEAVGNAVRARFRDKEWVFPREDCVLLPVANTTAELVAHYIAGRLLADLRARRGFVPRNMRVEVEENVGQSAAYEWRA